MINTFMVILTAREPMYGFSTISHKCVRLFTKAEEEEKALTEEE